MDYGNKFSKVWSVRDMKNNKELVMTPEQVEISIRHSKNNIVRSVVLMKRAVNTLTFADRSLEGTDELLMIQDIGIARDDIAEVINRLEKYL